MTLGNHPAPPLITRPEELHELVEILLEQTIVGVDTESNSLHAYREQVCLIQFSTVQADYLVDPLTLADLSALEKLFASHDVEKVFHAAEYDLLCLSRDFGFRFANLFDTMIAARTLGYKSVGLAAILEHEFQIKIDKRPQRADWGQRPLPRQLQDYARLDTHYLIPIRKQLAQALIKRDLLPLAEEDFRRLAQVQHNGNEEESSSWWRVRGAYDLEPQQAAVLMELCRYRNKIAQSANRPLFKVISDRALTAIAQASPRSLEELKGLPGVTSYIIERHGRGLLQSVRRGLEGEPLHPPRSPRPDFRFTERLEALRQWRKDTALRMGVMSDVVLPRDLMHAIAHRNPTCQEELAAVMHSAPWRLERFGTAILSAITSVSQVASAPPH